MTRLRFALTLTVALIVGVGLFLAGTAPTSAAPALRVAAPSGCMFYWDSTQARSHCTGGTGHHRPCGVERTAANSTRITKCRPWAIPGTYAWVYPDSGYFFVGGFIQTKST